MSNQIRIKRRLKGSTETSLPDLLTGELAYDEIKGKLYIGESDGSLVNAKEIGGSGWLLPQITGITDNIYVPKNGDGANGTWNISVTGNAGFVTNGVYTTGNQSISGIKTFSSGLLVTTTGISNGEGFDFVGSSGNGIYVPSGTIRTKDLYVDGWLTVGTKLDILSAAEILSRGPIVYKADKYVFESGIGIFTNGLYVGPTGSPTGVSLSGHKHTYNDITDFCTGVASCVNTPLNAGSGLVLNYLEASGIYLDIGQGDGIVVSDNYISVDSTIVRTSGTQNISGVKTFFNTSTFNSGILSSGTNTLQVAAASSATQFVVFTGDPSSASKPIYTRTPSEVKSDIGLGNVTNNIQVKQTTGGTTVGYIPTWNSTSGELLASGYAVSTDLSTNNGSTYIPRADALVSYVGSAISNGIATNDAMIFKGGIDCSTNPNYPAADRGWTYKISVAGKIGGSSGPTVEVNDTIICTEDGTLSGNHADKGSYWIILRTSVVDSNILVTGPSSSISGNVAIFDGTTGKAITGSVIYQSGNSIGIGNPPNHLYDLTVGTMSVTDASVGILRTVPATFTDDGFIFMSGGYGFSLDTELGYISLFDILTANASNGTLHLDNNYGTIGISNDNGALRIDVGSENYSLGPLLANFDVDFSANNGTFNGGLDVGGTTTVSSDLKITYADINPGDNNGSDLTPWKTIINDGTIHTYNDGGFGFNGAGYNITLNGNGGGYGGASIGIAGSLSAGSGNFSQALTVGTTGVSLIGHTHSISSIDNFGSGVSGVIVGSGNYLTRFNASNSGITNSIIYQSGDNIGIGIQNPDQLLTVNGTIRSAVVLARSLAINAEQGLSPTIDIDVNSVLTNSKLLINNTNAVINLYDVLSLVGGTDSVYIGSNAGAKTPVSTLDVSGVITASGGNSNNWNTAYSWGNHSSAGYPQTSSVVKITGSQTISGNITFGGSTTTVFTTGAKVGIGIDSPSYLLDIYDDNLSSFRAADSNNNYITLGPPEDGANVARINAMDRIYLTTNAGDIDITGTVRINGETLQKAALGSATNGQLLIGNGSSFNKSTLTAGTGISITNASGSITINISGLQSLITNPVTGTGIGLANSGYISRWDSSSGILNSNIYQRDNFIGIGTTDPSGMLHVGGNLYTSGSIYFRNGNSWVSPALSVHTHSSADIYSSDGTVINYGSTIDPLVYSIHMSSPSFTAGAILRRSDDNSTYTFSNELYSTTIDCGTF